MDFMKYSIDRLVRSMAKEQVDAIPEYIGKMPTHGIANYLLHNNGNETFTKKNAEWGLNQPGVSAGAAYADLDNDGDLDLITSNANELAGIYRNNANENDKNNYLKIKLEGSSGNAQGIGTKVKVFCGGNLYFQEQSPVRGFQSSVDPVLHFGLGAHTQIDSVHIIWPDDRFQKLTAIKGNQTIVAKQSAATGHWQYDTAAGGKNSLLQQTTLAGAAHTENNFNDFTIQTLLPHYFSRQGPCIEVADVNGDGLEDFFLGGAAGTPGRIMMQQANASFSAKELPAFNEDAASEDVAALFFDADGDGDKDLYVVSGGYESGEAGPALQDRLYLNEGKGIFIKNTAAIPAMRTSKSCVKAADIDGDGDLDLFVGGRVVPGKYPLTPDSYLLQNDGNGNFTDITEQAGAAIRRAGMVTDAAFTISMAIGSTTWCWQENGCQ
jgi:enediyne biosynthesis protein E4